MMTKTNFPTLVLNKAKILGSLLVYVLVSIIILLYVKMFFVKTGVKQIYYLAYRDYKIA